jgi:hypothetical protein
MVCYVTEMLQNLGTDLQLPVYRHIYSIDIAGDQCMQVQQRCENAEHAQVLVSVRFAYDAVFCVMR